MSFFNVLKLPRYIIKVIKAVHTFLKHRLPLLSSLLVNLWLKTTTTNNKKTLTVQDEMIRLVVYLTKAYFTPSS